MKSLVLFAILIVSSLAQAQTFKENEIVFDTVTQSVMRVDYNKDGLVYLVNPRSPENPWHSLPRDNADLVKRAKLSGPIQEGDTVSFFNTILKRYDFEKVVYTFANGLAHIHLTTYNDAAIRDYLFLIPTVQLGYEVPEIAGLDLRVGEKACPRKQTPRFRRGGSAGTAVKFFTNGTVVLMYKDFFLQTNYEAIPLENLSLKCKK